MIALTKVQKLVVVLSCVFAVVCGAFLSVAIATRVQSGSAFADEQPFFDGAFDWCYQRGYFSDRLNLGLGSDSPFYQTGSLVNNDNVYSYVYSHSDNPVYQFYVTAPSNYGVLASTHTAGASSSITFDTFDFQFSSSTVTIQFGIGCVPSSNSYVLNGWIFDTIDILSNIPYSEFTIDSVLDIYANSGYARSNISYSFNDSGSFVVRSSRSSSFVGKPDRTSILCSVAVPSSSYNYFLGVLGVQEYSGYMRALPSGYCPTSSVVSSAVEYLSSSISASSYAEGKRDGESIGYSKGISDANTYTWDSLFTSIFESPINIVLGTYDNNPNSDTYGQRLGGLLNLTIPLGSTTLNLGSFVVGLLSFCLVRIVVRLILRWFI